MPLFVFTGKQQERTTEQLAEVSNAHGVGITEQVPVLAGSQGSQGLLGLPPVTTTTGRITRIPGSRKRQQEQREKRAGAETEDFPKLARRMSPRLRHGIVFASILLVMVTTLLYLTPLSSGHGGSAFFQSIGNWVHAQQMNWQLQAHLAQVAQNDPAQNNPLPAPPPMTLPTSAYVAIAQQDAINAGISPVYFSRQINMESGFNPNAYSPSGAEGIAQFMPGTAAGLGINPWDPKAALNAAAHLMASYAKNYGGDYAMALAAYNGGSGTVQYAVSACGAANWTNCLPGETRAYIRGIMGV
ncbi:MAG TPA: transglycosylase SLT domain-containing protein [Ktedonobacteraceae bacterium]